MKSNNLPSGWDDLSIQGLAEHYDHQVPSELVPHFRQAEEESR
jgi:hypothetical protein